MLGDFFRFLIDHANFPAITVLLGTLGASAIGGWFLLKGKKGETREQHAETVTTGFTSLVASLQKQIEGYDARLLRYEGTTRLQDEKLEQMRVALEALRDDYSVTEAAVERAFDDLHKQWPGVEIPKFRTGDIQVLTPLLPPQWIPPDRH